MILEWYIILNDGIKVILIKFKKQLLKLLPIHDI
jgi:hypothetical protein